MIDETVFFEILNHVDDDIDELERIPHRILLFVNDEIDEVDDELVDDDILEIQYDEVCH